MLVFEEIGIIRVSYEKDNGLFVHEWLDYNPDGRDSDIRTVLERLYELLVDYPVEKVLVKTDQTTGAFSPDIQVYIREVQLPRLLANTQLKYIATVKSDNIIARICTDVWEEQFKAGSPLILHDVDNEAEAREWFSQLDRLQA
jgi:hypothetical protein